MALAILRLAALALLPMGPPLAAGSASSLMDIAPDGGLLACSNRDSGTVSFVDLASRRTVGEVAVGHKPEGVSFVGGSHRLAVALHADDRVVFVERDDDGAFAVAGSTEVFDEPYGVVSDAAGTRIWVTLEYPGRVVEIDTATRAVTRTFTAGRFPRGLALTADGTRLLVTEYLTSIVRAIDIESGAEADSWPGASTDNLARQIIIHPTRPKAYLTHVRSRTIAAHGEGSIFPYVSVISLGATGEGRRRTRIPMDAFRGNFVVANPWDAAIAPDGKRLYVVFSGTDDMFSCDVIDDDYVELSYRDYERVGRNPRAVRVAPDGTVWVYNALDFNVTAHDPENLETIATVPVTENPLGEEILRGKRLFYSALQPMVGRRWISCSSCHPDGDADGRTWNNPEGLRNTPALAGLAWTHPLHWSADRDETQDFEHTIRGLLMQGRGLIRGKVNAELGEPNRGLSADLDALAAYTNSHEFPLSPHARSGLGEAARRGRELFFSGETGCATCHSGPFYTDSTPGEKIERHDVGTGNDDPGEKMGPAYDTPTLLGVYRTAPYLHHGTAATLADVLTTRNRDDRHGRTSHLTPDQIADLVAFLEALPYEDPEPAAREKGMRRVAR